MEKKTLVFLLYTNLYKSTEINKIQLICNLFNVSKTTIYRWIDEHKKSIYKIDNKIDNKIITEFESKLITKEIVYYIVSYILNNSFYNIKKIKNKLNVVFPNNGLSIKHIKMIIYTNNFIFKNNYTHEHKPYKINSIINDFIIDSIKNNNCLTAVELVDMIFIKFKIKISLSSVYNIFKKNNYVYKKTTVNINPYTFEEQENQLTNVYEHLVNDSNLIELKNDYQLKKTKNDILNENVLIIGFGFILELIISYLVFISLEL